jgi:mRNA interferase MazF
MKRGDLLTVAMPGDFSKPRPALIVQADRFQELGTVTVLLLTGSLIDAPLIRISIAPYPENGLKKPSQVMIDKAMAVKQQRLGEPFGHVEDSKMLEINRALLVFLGLV